MSSSPDTKTKSKMNPDDDTNLVWRVLQREEIVMNTLSPLEGSIMSLQSVLVWENRYHSIALFVSVHLLFWLATALRVYYTIGIIGVLIVANDMWKNHIWPEIRVEPAPGEDGEGWTPVHPNLLSVPEISHYLGEWWVKLEDYVNSAVRLRKTNHPKFFIFALIILLSLAVFGTYVSGICLAYFTVLFCLLWPCVLYYNGLEKLKELLGPTLNNIEARMKIRRSGSRKDIRKRGKRKRGAVPAPQLEMPSDTDSEKELEEFTPHNSLPETRASPEDSDSDDVKFSGIPSQEHSDMEDSNTGTDDLSSLTVGLSDMPSYDDTLDGTAYTATEPVAELDDPFQLERELSEAIAESSSDKSRSTTPKEIGSSLQRQASSGSTDINFDLQHFSESQESQEKDNDTEKDSAPLDDVLEESHLTKDLCFQEEDLECTEEDNGSSVVSTGMKMLSDRGQALVSQGQALVSQGQALVSALGTATPVVSQTVTGLVASTMSGLSSLREKVAGRPSEELPPCTCPANQEADSEEGAEPTEERAEPKKCPRHMMDSIDSQQLEAEFEFLNEEDLSQEDVGDVDGE